ncbi:MAG: carboxypeptidase regulatory-like domain-containing protein [Planctomycetota bacterium]|nr:MAG: carboxypeptidase regulatory-like domain-containing protein [Planctomycetota bacterium]
MNILRGVLAAAALGVALVFLASVACPRRDERARVPSPEALSGLADPAPARLQPERTPEDSAGARSPQPGAPAAYALLVRVLDAHGGQPVAQAEIELRLPEGAVAQQALYLAADAAGERRLEGLPAPAVTLIARREGFFDSDPVIVALPAAGELQVLELRAGAWLDGTVQGRDGVPVNYGEVTALQLESGTSLVAKPGRGGAFRLPALEGGTWRLGWREHVHAPADPSAHAEVVLLAHQRYRAEITLETAGAAGDAAQPAGIRVQPAGAF